MITSFVCRMLAYNTLEWEGCDGLDHCSQTWRNFALVFSIFDWVGIVLSTIQYNLLNLLKRWHFMNWDGKKLYNFYAYYSFTDQSFFSHFLKGALHHLTKGLLSASNVQHSALWEMLMTGCNFATICFLIGRI